MKTSATRTLPFLLLLASNACGGDDGAASDDDSSTSGAETEDDDETGTDEPADPQYIVVGGTFTPEGATGYAIVTNDLSSSTEIDLGQALTLSGGGSWAVAPDRSGTFFAGDGESPTLRKYGVATDGTISLDGELSLANYGFTAAVGVRNPMHFLSDTRAYFIDAGTAQVVVWNPADMLLETSFSLDGLAEGDLQTRGNFVHADGDRLVFSVRYFRPDGSAEQLGRVAIIDTTSDTVSYADETTCGNLAWSAVNRAGDIYFASHTAQAAAYEAGTAGEPASRPCIVRMLAGSDGFDDSYYVDLLDLAGEPAGALIQGSGDTAYVLVLSPDAPELTPANVDSSTILPFWGYQAITLGDGGPSLTPVEGLGLGGAYGIAFTAEIGPEFTPTPFIVAVAGDLSNGTFYGVGDPDAFETFLTAPGFPQGAARLR